MTVKSRYFPFGLNSEKFHVFCFHHAGGSALTYRAWAVRDFDNVEFVPVETPGFGTLSDINIPGSVDEAAQSFCSGKRLLFIEKYHTLRRISGFC